MVTSGGLNRILKDWDSANGDQRKHLLGEFCDLTRNKTALDMQEELGHRTALLFARFSAALRLRFNRPGVGLILDGICRFTAATGGLEHIEDLVDSGAVMTVIELIGLESPTETDKVSALKVLLSVARSGIETKEILCKTGAIRIICECLAKAKTDECQTECNKLLECLSTGNPNYVGAIYRALIALLPCDSPCAVHIALRLLRRVQHNVEPIKELAAPLLATFGSYHGEVRYEARALFIQLIHSHISNYLFAALIKALKETEEWTTVNFIRQACAALTVQEIVEKRGIRSDLIQNELLNRHIISQLIRTLANRKFAEAQRNASVALYSIIQRVPEEREGVLEALGPLSKQFLITPSQIQDEIDEVAAKALIINASKL